MTKSSFFANFFVKKPFLTGRGHLFEICRHNERHGYRDMNSVMSGEFPHELPQK